MTLGPSSPALQEPVMGGGSSPGARRAVRWTKGRKTLFGVIGFGSVGIAGIGFVGSYAAVRVLAVKKDFGWFAPVFPLGVDLGIAVLLALDLALTWVGLGTSWLRYVAWLLTAATIGFNAASSWPDLLGAAMHATIPVLFISVTEAVRNAIAKATAIENNLSMDTIRRSRWFLAPLSTFAIWRSMKLWEIREYSVALDFYQNKRERRQELRHRYGWRWRRRAPWEELLSLRRARIGRGVAQMDLWADVAPMGLELAPQPDPAARPLPAPEPVPAAAPVAAVAPPVPAPAGPARELVGQEEPAAVYPAAPVAVEPAPFAAAAYPQAVPVGAVPVQAVVEEPPRVDRPWDVPGHGLGTGSAEPAPSVPSASGTGDGHELELEPEFVQEQDLRDQDPEDDENPDEHLGEDDEDRQPPVDLGVAPPGESKVQRAERIYLAHRQAGVELTRNDLARWAGYQNLGSGRTQYNRLEQLHGPIVVREGTDQLDFDWRRPERAAEGAGARSLSAV